MIQYDSVSSETYQPTSRILSPPEGLCADPADPEVAPARTEPGAGPTGHCGPHGPTRIRCRS